MTRREYKENIVVRKDLDFGLDADDGPIFTVISRLTWQKGIDVLLECIDHLVGIGGRLALLGSGDKAIEAVNNSVARARAWGSR